MPITHATRKVLWARSGNLCAICRRPLVEDETDQDDRAVIGEECHLFAQGTEGPRSQGTPPADVHHYTNLILLCGGCHTLIDSQEATYTIERIAAIRDKHEAWVAETLHTAQGSPASTISPEPQPANDWDDPGTMLPGPLSDELFAQRLADAFPGTVGLTVIDAPDVAIERLSVVLRRPLDQWHFSQDRTRHRGHPFWWFRGGSCLHIENFDQIDARHCLLDVNELNIRRVAAFRRSYQSMWDFLYVETDADPSVGVYKLSSGSPIELAATRSAGFYYYEEYAIWNDRAISRADYDDRATLVDGKPRRVTRAELRIRYLTPYNFIVCGNRHVINDNDHDSMLRDLLDGILRGTNTLDDLANVIDRLPKPTRYLADWD